MRKDGTVTSADLRKAAQAVDDAYIERNALIASALAQGWTLRAVAEEVGISYARVGQIARELGRTERRYVPN